MLNDILKLNGAQKLNKTEQQNIYAGGPGVIATDPQTCASSGGTWVCVGLNHPSVLGGFGSPVHTQSCSCVMDGCSNASQHANCTDIMN